MNILARKQYFLSVLSSSAFQHLPISISQVGTLECLHAYMHA